VAASVVTLYFLKLSEPIVGMMLGLWL